MPDRSRGLIAFGVLQIVVGAACALLLAALIASSERAARSGNAAGGVSTLVFAYGVATAHFVVAGIGSIRARRWARSLSAAVAALWLAGGSVATVSTVVVVPRIAPDAALVRIAAVMLVAFVALPLALLMFYAREDVRLTCERRDGKRRWTDRAPLPVLALTLVMAFAAAWLLVNLSTPVVPMFGTVLTGAPAALTLLALSALCAVLAVQLYRLKESAWWTVVLLQVIGCTLAGIAMLRNDGPVNGDPVFRVIVLASWIGYFAFLLYLRRYFAGGRDSRPRVVAAT